MHIPDTSYGFWVKLPSFLSFVVAGVLGDVDIVGHRHIICRKPVLAGLVALGTVKNIRLGDVVESCGHKGLFDGILDRLYLDCFVGVRSDTFQCFFCERSDVWDFFRTCVRKG